jgi:hypothetical protein
MEPSGMWKCRAVEEASSLISLPGGRPRSPAWPPPLPAAAAGAGEPDKTQFPSAQSETSRNNTCHAHRPWRFLKAMITSYFYKQLVPPATPLIHCCQSMPSYHKHSAESNKEKPRFSVVFQASGPRLLERNSYEERGSAMRCGMPAPPPPILAGKTPDVIFFIIMMIMARN